ncbi:aldehyde dehydrogenase family protein [Devosia marina]|uniref:Aldehyde dehydrogenase family protein n=1 Tax=Devosia marina TaxID=2683198 RepID=A0A7X3FPU5_9HYPH|nr:aldehyde dehydrogenase family protein [Devosia marina]MVS98380.1 aldehyde dehydrogenase family protein [Devosia marina]
MNEFSRLSGPPQQPKRLGLFINGQYTERANMEYLPRSSPGYGVDVSEVALGTVDDVNDAVAAARGVFERGSWSRMPGADRARILVKAAYLIRERAEELAYWETLEAGKPISQARAEINDGAGHYEYCAGLAQTLHGQTFNTYGDDLFGLVIREPVGVVGLINPWNFPFIVLSERIPYILASGNSVVVKPSEMTSYTTLALADILREAGLPDGVYNVVTGTGPVVGQALAEHRDIDVISFTGSTRTGEAIVRASTTNFKKTSLELGGKNPQIVFADSDLEDAADGVAFGLCFNAGQCCVSGSRLVVEEKVHDEFVALLAEKLKRVRIGDSFDEASQMGAVVSTQHRDKIESYLTLAQEEGGQIAFGGERLNITEGGRFLRPALLVGIKNNMRVAQEEIFGPVLSALTFRTEDEAVQIANDSPYGLAASIWTKNIDKALGMIRRVNGGRTWINTTIAGGPGQPLGGYRQSGVGREAGLTGVEEYTEVKSVHVGIGKRNHWIS